jgi:hypothetical protein
MTAVRDVDYAEYDRLRQDPGLVAEARRDGYVYFAIQHREFAEQGRRQYSVVVTQRYRAPLPEVEVREDEAVVDTGTDGMIHSVGPAHIDMPVMDVDYELYEEWKAAGRVSEETRRDGYVEFTVEEPVENSWTVTVEGGAADSDVRVELRSIRHCRARLPADAAGEAE